MSTDIEAVVEEWNARLILHTEEGGFLHYEEGYQPVDFDTDVMGDWLVDKLTASEARGREEERATIIRNLPDLEDAIEEELYRWDMYPGSEKQAHAVVELISAALLPKEGTRE